MIHRLANTQLYHSFIFLILPNCHLHSTKNMLSRVVAIYSYLVLVSAPAIEMWHVGGVGDCLR